MKKIVGMLVIITALLLLMTVSVNADSIEIQRVDIKTDKVIPEIGDKVSDLDYNYEVYANEEIKLSTENIFDNEIGYIECYKKTDENLVLMEDNECFGYGGTYIIERWFVLPNEMNIINLSVESSDAQAYINGEKANTVFSSSSGDTRGEYCIVSNTFTLNDRENIEKVNIKSNGLLPKVGDVVKNVNKDYEVYANDTIKLSTNLLDYENVTYYVKENDEYKILNEDDVFEDGRTYVIKVGFRVPGKMALIYDDLICFDLLGSRLSETEGMLNGKKVGYVSQTGSGYDTDEFCYIIFEYTVQEEIIESEKPDETQKPEQKPAEDKKEEPKQEETKKEETKKEDTTKAPGKIPYAGGTIAIVISMIATSILGTVAYIKNRELKGI